MKTVVIVGLGIAGLASTAQGQSFNIDLDISTGSPEVGRGVPSDAFGAAASQPGRWNRYPVTATNPVSLVALDGNPTNVQLRALRKSGAGGGWNNPLNTGDFSLLLNDAATLHLEPHTWIFSGLVPGIYQILTYAVSPIPSHTTPLLTEVSIAGLSQIVTGPMPGNSFGLHVTHALHEVVVSDGELAIAVRGLDSERLSKLNGFQIVAVPEPLSATAFVAGFVILAIRRKRTAD